MRSYRSSCGLRRRLASAHPDTCAERAGSCPRCTRCAASWLLGFCWGTRDRARMNKHVSLVRVSIAIHVLHEAVQTPVRYENQLIIKCFSGKDKWTLSKPWTHAAAAKRTRVPPENVTAQKNATCDVCSIVTRW